MIDAYDQNTGDGQWLRQSLEILKGEVAMPECFELMERLQLCADYTDLTGKELPEHIRKLSLDRLREEVRQAKEHGIVFGEPKTPLPADESSLMDWDRQDDKNGNAYA